MHEPFIRFRRTFHRLNTLYAFTTKSVFPTLIFAMRSGKVKDLVFNQGDLVVLNFAVNVAFLVQL